LRIGQEGGSLDLRAGGPDGLDGILEGFENIPKNLALIVLRMPMLSPAGLSGSIDSGRSAPSTNIAAELETAV
jgi:hypothetical protein